MKGIFQVIKKVLFFASNLFIVICNEVMFLYIRVGMVFQRKGKKKSKYAIVIQGPVTEEVIFDIIRYYRWSMKSAEIILSTWNTTTPELLDRLGEVVDYLVVSELPPICGRANVNYQMESTLKGILKAREIGAEFVLKVRSNSLLMSKKLFEFYEKMSEKEFEEGANKYGLKAKIMTEYRENFNNVVPFSLCDFTFLGHTDDMLKLWGGEA